MAETDSAIPTPTPPGPAHARPQPYLNTFRALWSVITTAILVATLFSIWTPGTVLTFNFGRRINPELLAGLATATPMTVESTRGSMRVGIVSGHWGNDSGAVCQDKLTEADVNLKIASLVKQNLSDAGYTVDLLKEFDPRLSDYEGAVLLSIHNDSCDFVNDEATGFKVAAARATMLPEKANHLTDCLVDRYSKATHLRFHYNSITRDMTEYHAFDEINPQTPAAIIETGFLNLDRTILTEGVDKVAQGVTAGLLCFLQNEIVQPTPTPPTTP